MLYTPEQLVNMQLVMKQKKQKTIKTTNQSMDRPIKGDAKIRSQSKKPHFTSQFYSTFHEDDLYYYQPGVGDIFEDCPGFQSSEDDDKDSEFVCESDQKQKSVRSIQHTTSCYRTRSLTAKGGSITEPIEICS